MTPEDRKLLASVKEAAENVLAQVKGVPNDDPGNPQMVRDLASCVISLTEVIGRNKL